MVSDMLIMTSSQACQLSTGGRLSVARYRSLILNVDRTAAPQDQPLTQEKWLERRGVIGCRRIKGRARCRRTLKAEALTAIRMV